MIFDHFITQLQHELSKPLPGRAGQVDMVPQPINNTRFNFKHVENAKSSAVMILLYPDNGAVFFPLMERNKYPGAHSGQISLPGGKKEPQDPDLTYTAKRETSEEMGVPQEDINFLGHLSETYVEVSNFKILPSVGYTFEKPIFNEDKREVENLFQANVYDLIDPKNQHSTKKRVREDLELCIPYFDVEGQMVWGATAMIISEFLNIVNRIEK